jgi:hypothetical protein
MAQQISNPNEKLRYYRHAAEEAERSGRAATDPDVRIAYQAIARTWVYLAEQLEREMALNGQDSMLNDSDDDLFVPQSEKSATHRSR